MPCFNDSNGMVALVGCIVSSVSYVTSSVAVGSVLWFKGALGLFAGLFVYVTLADIAPNIWTISPSTVSLTVASVAAFLCFLVSMVTNMGALYVTMGLASPFLLHNSQLVAEWIQANIWMGAPAWTGTVVFVGTLSLAVALVWYSQVLHILGIVMRIIMSSLMVFLFARLAYLEHTNVFDFCCNITSFNFLDDGVCPMGFDNPAFDALLLALLFVAFACAWRFRDPQGVCAHCFKRKIKVKPAYAPVSTR
jgi:hypothetical protein